MRILVNLNPNASAQQRIELLLNEAAPDAGQPPLFYRFPALPPQPDQPLEIPISDVRDGM